MTDPRLRLAEWLQPFSAQMDAALLAERQRVETHPTEEAQASGLICIG